MPQRNLPIPPVKMIEFIDTISNYTDFEKKERFKNYKGYILLQERLYFLRGIDNKFNYISLGNPIEDRISTTQFKDLYDRKLVGGNGRAIYNAIFKSTEICPTCLLRGIDQVDHFLPKSKYPLYSVSPLNLVPICEKCNGVKSAKDANTFTFIHPYFHELNDLTWLKARIHIDSNIIGFNYFMDIPDTLENHIELEKVISEYLKALKLLPLYNSKASELHSNMQNIFRDMYDVGGKETVLALFKSFYKKGCKIGTSNSSEAVFYKALIDDD
ncbi:HNH endonuclease [Solibacillus sp. NPDC093137]|uniref:HNH endonuclease n=1 Tax=Solibacillus sp. NPDC093137 TaxID=3390678 RepID=UPI003CFD1A64